MRKVKLLSLFAILFILFNIVILESVAFALTDGKKRIAVLKFSANNISEDIARIVRNNFELNLFRTDLFEMLEQNQIDLILKERKQQLTECSDKDCASRIGETLSADYVIIGSVDKLDKLTINIKVVDVMGKSVVIADSQDVDEIGEIRNSVSNVTERVSIKVKDYGMKTETTVSPSHPLFLSVNLHYLGPGGYMKDLFDNGYGLSFDGMMGDIVVPGFYIGFKIAYLYFFGKEKKAHHAVLMPVLFNIAYKLTLWNISLFPNVSTGPSYNTVYYYTDTSYSDYSRDSNIQLILSSGLKIEYSLSYNSRFYAGADYNTIFEKDGMIRFFSGYAGGGMMF